MQAYMRVRFWVVSPLEYIHDVKTRDPNYFGLYLRIPGAYTQSSRDFTRIFHVTSIIYGYLTAHLDSNHHFSLGLVGWGAISFHSFNFKSLAREHRCPATHNARRKKSIDTPRCAKPILINRIYRIKQHRTFRRHFLGELCFLVNR